MHSALLRLAGHLLPDDTPPDLDHTLDLEAFGIARDSAAAADLLRWMALGSGDTLWPRFPARYVARGLVVGLSEAAQQPKFAAEPGDSLLVRVRRANNDLETTDQPWVRVLLGDVAEALQQRLGLLRDTERRLEETVAELNKARAKAEIDQARGAMCASPFLAGLEANIAAGDPTATITLTEPPDRAKLDAALARVGITPTEDLRGPCWLALDLLLAARARTASVELALQKRQATVDRQGNELGRLRVENAGLRAIRGLSREAPCDEAAEIGRLTSILADETRAANMFRRRCERYEQWFALPPDQRHPLGPELTPELEPTQTDLAERLRTEAAAEDDWYPKGGRAKHAPLLREAAARIDVLNAWVGNLRASIGATARGRTVLGGKGLQALVAHRMVEAARVFDARGGTLTRPSDIHELVELALGGGAAADLLRLAREGMGPTTEPQPRTVHSGAELRAWLSADDGDPGAVIALAQLGLGRRHTLTRDPTSYDPENPRPDPTLEPSRGTYITVSGDPAVLAQLGLQAPCPHTAERESGKRVPAGAGNRPTEVCSACRCWRVMGPGESWNAPTVPYPGGSV